MHLLNWKNLSLMQMILSIETDKRLTQGDQHAQQQDPQHVCSLSGLSAL